MKTTKTEIEQFLQQEFPQSLEKCRIEEVSPRGATLGEIGLVGLAVTTNLNINFLRKPSGGTDIRGECKLIKVGKALIVGEVWIYSIDHEEPVAHVTGTYSIPPQR